MAHFAKFLGESPEDRWGTQLFRVSSDMMLVCDQDLNILFHNRGFLKGIGHQAGSYVGFSLIDFFPAADREQAYRAFDSLAEGSASGLRINATLLTRTEKRQFDIRVVRSLRPDGYYNYYLVARDETERIAQMEALEKLADNRLLEGLPVAAWRTDSKLQITHISGTLWNVLNVDMQTITGGDLSDPRNHRLPRFLLDVDYCDTMAGLTLHSDVEWRGESFEVTVEPFVNDFGKVIGTVGMMRRSKRRKEENGVEHLQFPGIDPTEPIRPLELTGKTRTIEIGPPPESESTRPVRPNIRPLSAADVMRSPLEKPDFRKTGSVALSN